MDLDELVFHPLGGAGPPRSVPTFVGGSGSHLMDADGRTYLDFSSQLVFTNLGHQHPRIVAAIKSRQTGFVRWRGPRPTSAARRPADRRGRAQGWATCCSSQGVQRGSSTRCGWLACTGRPKVLAAYALPYGSTTTSIHLTGDPRRWAMTLAPPGRSTSSAHSSTGRRSGRNPRGRVSGPSRTLEQVILLEGASTIAALVLEPVTGSSGVVVPPVGYLRGVRDLCTRHGIVFIADEVMAGFGRTGAWFAVDHDGVAPTYSCSPKGVNSGTLPWGGVLVGDRIRETFTERPYPAGMTYSGHPLACASAVGAIGAMKDEGQWRQQPGSAPTSWDWSYQARREATLRGRCSRDRRLVDARAGA